METPSERGAAPALPERGAAQPGAPAQRVGSLPGATPQEDLLFGQVLIRRGFATREQVRDALALQAKQAAAPSASRLRLGDILIRQGHVRLEQVQEALKLLEAAPVLTCPKCGSLARVLAYDPAKAYACKSCRSTMIVKGAASSSASSSSSSSASRVIAPIAAAPDDVRTAAEDPKRRFGKYVLVAEIGSGGMGKVFRAWDTTLGRTVALKLLVEIRDAADVERFLREARTAGALDHPNVAQVFDVGEHEGQYFLAMRFIDGEDFAGRKLAPRRAAQVARTAADALAYAHAQGIIHRDVKPHNLMEDRDGRVWVMDFGLAKAVRAKSALTQSGSILGTPSYMSPEQADGRLAEVGIPSDVYSLGATLYELLTGKPPFKGESPIETVMKVIDEDPVPPHLRAPGVPPDLSTICLTAMAKEPPLRYPNMESLRADLDRFLAGEPIAARSPSIVARVRRRIRRNRAILIPVGVAALLLAAAAVVLPVRAHVRSREFAQRKERGAEALAGSRFEEALQELTRAERLRPRDADVQRMLAASREALDTARREAQAATTSREALDRAKPAYERGVAALEDAFRWLYRPETNLGGMRDRLTEAARELSSAIEAHDAYADAYYARGRARALLFEGDDAERDFTRALALSPVFPSARLARGRLRLERAIEERLHLGWTLGETARARVQPLLDGAREDFEAAIAAGAAEDEEFARALLAVAENRLDEALTIVTAAAGRQSAREDLWKLAGDIRVLGRGSEDPRAPSERSVQLLREALAAYDRAIQLRVNYYEARILRGYVRSLSGDPPGARDDYAVARAIRPGDPLACWMEGSTLLQAFQGTVGQAGPEGERKLDEALAWFDEGLEARPDSVILHGNRATTLIHLGRNEEAIASLDRALASNPDLPWLWYAKGSTAARLGRAEIAIEALEHAAELSPRDASTWYNLGAAYNLAGRRTDAIHALRQAIDLGHPRADDIRTMIQQLQGSEY